MNDKAIRILYVSPHWPHTPTFGSEIRSAQIRQALERIGDVDLAVMDGNCRGDEAGDRSGFTNVKQVLAVKDHPKGALKKICWMLNPRMPYPHGCGVGLQEEARLLRALRNYDLVWFSNLRTPNMFANWAWPRSVVDIDDVPSTFARSILSSERNPAKLALAAKRYLCWRQRERLLSDRFRVLAVCSEQDRRYLKGMGIKAPIRVIPNASPRIYRDFVRKPAVPIRVGFIGLLEYLPNRNGIMWFIDRVWPLVRREIPGAILRIAGKGSEALRNGHPDIQCLGWIPDVGEEIATWSVMVVPIRQGAGTRGKIAQGFGFKCPIVATPMGAFGYEVENGKEILIGSTPHEFASYCVRLIRKEIDVDALVSRAYRKYLQSWSWDAIAPAVQAAAEDCLRLADVTFRVSDQYGSK